MQNLAVETAGVLAILVAVAHGILGETRVFARSTIEPPWAKRMMRLVWQCSTVAWIGGGILLIATASSFKSDVARYWIILVLAGVYGFGAAGNAWASRGRHFGWVLLTCVVVLAVIGI